MTRRVSCILSVRVVSKIGKTDGIAVEKHASNNALHVFAHTFLSDQVETVAVLGAGLMGAGIAQVSAEKGMAVLLKDRREREREAGVGWGGGGGPGGLHHLLMRLCCHEL